MAEVDPQALVRLLINQPLADLEPVSGDFSDDEITGFLAIEGGSIKRAAAQALDVLASNEALASKDITDRHLTTNGSKTAAALRAHASTLREQARDDEGNADGGYFEVVGLDPQWGPELTGYQAVDWPIY